MNELEVERLAAMENARWSRGSGGDRSDGAPADRIKADQAPRLDPQLHQGLWRATAPLRGPKEDWLAPRDRLADFMYVPQQLDN